VSGTSHLGPRPGRPVRGSTGPAAGRSADESRWRHSAAGLVVRRRRVRPRRPDRLSGVRGRAGARGPVADAGAGRGARRSWGDAPARRGRDGPPQPRHDPPVQSTATCCQTSAASPCPSSIDWRSSAPTPACCPRAASVARGCDPAPPRTVIYARAVLPAGVRVGVSDGRQAAAPARRTAPTAPTAPTGARAPTAPARLPCAQLLGTTILASARCSGAAAVTTISRVRRGNGAQQCGHGPPQPLGRPDRSEGGGLRAAPLRRGGSRPRGWTGHCHLCAGVRPR